MLMSLFVSYSVTSLSSELKMAAVLFECCWHPKSKEELGSLQRSPADGYSHSLLETDKP